MYKLTTCSLLAFQNFKAQAFQMRMKAGYWKWKMKYSSRIWKINTCTWIYIPVPLLIESVSNTYKFDLLKSLHFMLYLIIFTLYLYSTEEIAYISYTPHEIQSALFFSISYTCTMFISNDNGYWVHTCTYILWLLEYSIKLHF